MFLNNTNLFSVLKNRKLNSVRLSKTLSLEFIDDFFFFLVDLSNNTSSGLLDLRSVFHRCMYTRFTPSSLNKKYFALHAPKVKRYRYKKRKKHNKNKKYNNNSVNVNDTNINNQNNININKNIQYNKNNKNYLDIKKNKGSQDNKYRNNIYNESQKNHTYSKQSNNQPSKRRRRRGRFISYRNLTPIEREHMAKLSKRERIRIFIEKRRELREKKNRINSVSITQLHLNSKYQFRFSFLSRFVKRKSSFFNVDRRRLIFRYFYNSLLLKSNMYSFYGNSMLVFSLRSVDLDIRLDIHGSSFLERILYKPVSSLFFLNV